MEDFSFFFLLLLSYGIQIEGKFYFGEWLPFVMSSKLDNWLYKLSDNLFTTYATIQQ